MAVYPSGTPTDADLYVALDNFGSALNGAIDDAQTTITLTNVVGLPTVGILTIESEKIQYTGISGNDLTGVTRGFSATTAASHADATAVWFNVVEEHHNVLKDEVIAVATDNRNTFSADLDDSVAPTATATSLKQRLDMVVTQIKNILGTADWKDTVVDALSAIAGKLTKTLNNGKIFIGNASNEATEQTVTGDVTVSSAGVTAIANGVIVNNDINAAAQIDASKIADGSVSSAEFQYINTLSSNAQTQIDGKVAKAGDTMTGSLNVPSLNGSGVWGFRNRIINGDMRIDQRNVGAAYSISTTTYTSTIDRWGVNGAVADGVIGAQRTTTTPPAGFTHVLKLTATTADASIGATQAYLFSQRIEGSNTADFGWGSAGAKTATISFWVRVSKTGTFSVNVGNGGETRGYGSTYTVNAANTWEYKTITVPGDTSGTWNTDNTKGLTIYFSLGSGSSVSAAAGTWGAMSYGVTGADNIIGTLNATLEITGVQLELGSVATEFEFRPEAVELQLCQRYYYKLKMEMDNARTFPGYTLSTTLAIVMATLPVTMRTRPTALETTGTATDYEVRHAATGTVCSVVPAFNSSSKNVASLSFSVASGLTVGQGVAGSNATTNAFYAWSAEL